MPNVAQIHGQGPEQPAQGQHVEQQRQQVKGQEQYSPMQPSSPQHEWQGNQQREQQLQARGTHLHHRQHFHGKTHFGDKIRVRPHAGRSTVDDISHEGVERKPDEHLESIFGGRTITNGPAHLKKLIKNQSEQQNMHHGLQNEPPPTDR